MLKEALMGTLQERVSYLEGKVEDIRDLLTELNRRVDRIEQRIDRVEHRIDGLDDKMSRQFLWLVGIQVTTLIAVVGAVLSRG
jgi:uncharacterized protein Yka (UPF0111/DUF47 family)